MKKLSAKNTIKGKIPNKAGIYRIYNKKKKAIYIGNSRKLRHRIQSYHQKDDFEAHKSKKKLRSRAVYFTYRLMKIKQARELEARIKHKMKFNR